jgi:hypothetical protein
MAFPRLIYYGLLWGPIESSATEVCLERFAPTLPATVGESRTENGLRATACSGRRGHGRGRGADLKDERDIGGNDQ